MVKNAFSGVFFLMNRKGRPTGARFLGNQSEPARVVFSRPRTSGGWVMTLRHVGLLVLVLALAAACMAADKDAPLSMSAEMAPAPEATATLTDGPVGRASAMDESAAGQAAPSGGEAEPAPNPALLGRKLIRDGEATLKVKDVDVARAELEARVQRAGGFVAGVQHQRYAGADRLDLTLRLPTDGFSGFVRDLSTVGFVEQESADVQDVTDQWIDLGRRISTKEKLAARLEELIHNKSYQFRDLLEVERELARLRLEIEQLEGALRGLDDRIALSTLRIHLYQDARERVAPPDGVFAPLTNAIENAGARFKGSAQALMKFIGFFITLAVVGLPWLVVGGGAVALLIALIKWIARRQRRKTPEATNSRR